MTGIDRAPDERLAVVQEQLVGAVEGVLASDDWQAALLAAARFHRYSFENFLLIAFQHAKVYRAGAVSAQEPSMVAGFRQWEAMGRHVLAGQHGYTILRPNRVALRETRDLGTEVWRRLSRFEHPAPGGAERSGSVLNPTRPFGTATVFDICQTDGDPVPQPPMPVLLAGAAPAGLWDGIAGQITAAGFTLSDVASARDIDGANGLTTWSAATVQIRADMDDSARAKSAIHELGHVLLHDPRGPAGTVDVAAGLEHTRGVKEVEAESIAFVVGAAHGMDTASYSLPYISAWASRADGAKTVREVGTRVIGTARTILTGLDTLQWGNGQPPGLEQRLEAHREQTPTRASGRSAGRAPHPRGRSAQPVQASR